MDVELITAIRVALFVAASIVLTMVSWRPLHNPRSHGFYRFFAFEAIVVLMLLNVPYWFRNLFSPLQVVSWLLLVWSIVFVHQGFYLLRNVGGTAPRGTSVETYTFEETANLVTTGMYHYIRHPMYSALLLLAWGAFLKHVTLFSTLAVVLATVALIATAKVEEKENLETFGADYATYIKKTKMFIPYLF